ncbi:MAG: quinone-dependent dihydroorotate dehydrogenase [Kordiimonadaceae bacterium]|nr:quinone-dependent dihydroorotate dehydrogenase [Kordiimonadaceae bacterium]
MAFDLFPLVKPLLHALDAERAHTLTISALKAGLASLIATGKDPASLHTEVFGLSFSNPIGMAAGFDKNADVITPTHNLGFGFAEAGTVTPEPQVGNEKPRLFRLIEDQAVINRFGFNNNGLSYFAQRLQKLKTGGKPFGANVGANKTSEDKTADYVTGVESLYGLSDYFTVNISSPNTPGLRSLQSKEALSDLVDRVLKARQRKIDEGMPRIPILVKIAPDLMRQDITDIAEIARTTDIDGLIVSNTTITRPDSLKSTNRNQMGGLSGSPLMALATSALSKIYVATEGQVPLIGVGGIATGADAYAKIRAGASLVQLYSALVYQGPALVRHIKADLAACLEKDGFKNVSDAVGADHR